jgi:O-acetylhomoserine/O-acetylserine sulfhydrylase-like pyridoxal-dependent enzyme
MSNWCKNIILTYYQIREKAQLGLDKGDICHYSNSRYMAPAGEAIGGEVVCFTHHDCQLPRRYGNDCR